jgi:hypothetical protein
MGCICAFYVKDENFPIPAASSACLMPDEEKRGAATACQWPCHQCHRSIGVYWKTVAKLQTSNLHPSTGGFKFLGAARRRRATATGSGSHWPLAAASGRPATAIIGNAAALSGVRT